MSNIEQLPAFEPPAKILGLDEQIYHQLPFPGSTTLKTLITKTPLHWDKREHEEKDHLTLGSLWHGIMLEPEVAAKKFLVRPEHTQGTKNVDRERYVAWLSEVTGEVPDPVGEGTPQQRLIAAAKQLEEIMAGQGKTLVTSAMMSTAEIMRDRFFAKWNGGSNSSAGSVDVKSIFETGIEPEVTLIAKDPATGVVGKGRIDALPTGHYMLIDLKSSIHVCESDWARDAWRYHYPMQAAYYSRLAREVLGESYPMLFCVAESTPPYDSALYIFSQDTLRSADLYVTRALEEYARCMERNFWPGEGYNELDGIFEVRELDAPSWVYR
jgi:hypothetical protein